MMILTAILYAIAAMWPLTVIYRWGLRRELKKRK